MKPKQLISETMAKSGYRSPAQDSAGPSKRLSTVAQMLKMPEYAWATNSYLRHVIFEAEDRLGSGGVSVRGNGLAPAIVRIGRKVLIDLDEFDRWVEGHRMVGRGSAENHANTTQLSEV